MIKKKTFLSLIVPAYKQEKSIVRDIKNIIKTMDALKLTYEVIVVVDGFVDKTYEKIKAIKSRKIKVVGYPHNHGKGYAVRYGIGKAKGNLIAFIDAGMDLDPRGISNLLTIMEMKDADIVIGSKLHAQSKITYPWQRRILSRGYRVFVKLSFGLTIGDTQVGMKLFRKKVLEEVLPRLLVKRYAFDIEILAVAHYLGYTKIYEAPISLTFNKWSSITSTNFWKAIFNMMWDTAAVVYRLKILRYYDSRNKRKWKYDPELNFRINIG